MTHYIFDTEEDAASLDYWRLPIVFNSKRHTEKIEGCERDTQTWRMKERMKTVSVALVLCLNVGVDPPDIVKTQPCARLECWVDPLSIAPQKALEQIANNLQKQYEKWQPRARYKHSLDPTVDEAKRLCTSLRRNAKDERVLFHYNGHGVPKPTANGEIWVFNKTYTQYIPLSIYDLQQWMGAPSIYVYDCSCAGLIVESFKQFAAQHEREYEMFIANSKTAAETPPMPSYKSCIQLAACGANQILPMNPELPADLFTSCLTTPVKTALVWFVLQNRRKLVPEITVEDIDRIPGLLNDRRTMLGELNWIFTAITDTIAWNVLPKDTFQRLFRQDLLVASLFRNFLLAERVMRSYNCNPVSDPALPLTHHHPMWQAWDSAVDICLAQLPSLLKDPEASYIQSPFFSEQLTAFQVWLSFGFSGQSIPEQLPIVLQVLLSQVHRLRALELLGRFLDLGPWAVNLALSVGIFPYVLKLLQSSARELRPLLVFIWAKVLAVDSTCQNDLVRDGGYKYFLCILGDPYMLAEHRTMAAFAISCIVKNYRGGQLAALQNNVIAICLEQLNDPYPKLRQWVAICLGCMWANFEEARWCGVRDSAHEKLYTLLSDPEPEVRACAVYALGTFLNSTTERTDHANSIDHNIGMTLIQKVSSDGSPLVRMELVVALQWFLMIFENQFVAVAYQHMEEEKLKEAQLNQYLLAPDVPTPVRKTSGRDRLKPPLSSSPVSNNLESSGDGSGLIPLERMRKVSSSASLCSLSGALMHSPVSGMSLGYSSAFACIWRTLVALSSDPFPDVAMCAEHLMNYIKDKVKRVHGIDAVKPKKASSVSEPSSPSGKPNFLSGEFSPARQNEDLTQESGSKSAKGLHRWPDANPAYQQYHYFAQFHRIRKTFDKGPEIRENGEEPESQQEPKSPIVETNLVSWCLKYFTEPVIKLCENDTESETYLEREYRFLRNEQVRKGLEADRKLLEVSCKVEDQVFMNKNPSQPTIIRCHPYEPHLIVANKESYCVWDWENQAQLHYSNSSGLLNLRITAIELINAHDDTLLMIGYDDGSVRVWRKYHSEPELVTGFQVLQDLRPLIKGPGLVLKWEQQTCHLLASGGSNVIRIWDANKEMKVQDIQTECGSCVTSISSSQSDPHHIIVGCGDGTVRAYDRRQSPESSCPKVYSEHSGWVVNVALKNDSESGSQIISGSVAGDVRFWDLRHLNSVKSIPLSHGMTAMAVHPNLDLIACGAATQFISVYDSKGTNVSTLKYHDGFMGHRIGPVSCLDFHTHKAALAAGCTDSMVCVYSVRRD